MEITINQAGRFYDDFPDAFCRGTETEEDEFRVCFFDQKQIRSLMNIQQKIVWQ